MVERRAEVVHPTISMLGPDLVAPNYDQAEAIRRLRDPSRKDMALGEAILHAAGSVKAIVDPAAFDRGIQVSSAATAASSRARSARPTPVGDATAV